MEFYDWGLCKLLIQLQLPRFQIDEEILQEVVKMGFDRNQLIESLGNRMQNDVCSHHNSVIF